MVNSAAYHWEVPVAAHSHRILEHPQTSPSSLSGIQRPIHHPNLTSQTSLPPSERILQSIFFSLFSTNFSMDVTNESRQSNRIFRKSALTPTRIGVSTWIFCANVGDAQTRTKSRSYRHSLQEVMMTGCVPFSEPSSVKPSSLSTGPGAYIHNFPPSAEFLFPSFPSGHLCQVDRPPNSDMVPVSLLHCSSETSAHRRHAIILPGDGLIWISCWESK